MKIKEIKTKRDPQSSLPDPPVYMCYRIHIRKEADGDPVTHVCFGLRLMVFQFVPAEDASLWVFLIAHISNIR